MFSDKLKDLMRTMGLTQTKVAELTGVSKSAISQYLSGKNEPTKERKRTMAAALGVQEDYFETFAPVPKVQKSPVSLPVELAAKLMHKSDEWVRAGLQEGVFPFGYAVKMGSRWNYFISSVKFTEYTGIQVPVNEV